MKQIGKPYLQVYDKLAMNACDDDPSLVITVGDALESDIDLEGVGNGHRFIHCGILMIGYIVNVLYENEKSYEEENKCSGCSY